MAVESMLVVAYEMRILAVNLLRTVYVSQKVLETLSKATTQRGMATDLDESLLALCMENFAARLDCDKIDINNNHVGFNDYE